MIPSTMFLHNNTDGVDTIFSTMELPLENNTLEKWLGFVIRGSYQESVKDIRWEYEPVSDI